MAPVGRPRLTGVATPQEVGSPFVPRVAPVGRLRPTGVATPQEADPPFVPRGSKRGRPTVLQWSATWIGTSTVNLLSLCDTGRSRTTNLCHPDDSDRARPGRLGLPLSVTECMRSGLRRCVATRTSGRTGPTRRAGPSSPHVCPREVPHTRAECNPPGGGGLRASQRRVTECGPGAVEGAVHGLRDPGKGQRG